MLERYLAVDIGGTFIKLAILDRDTNFYKETKVPTVDNFPDLIKILKTFIGDEKIIGIAFSVPGTVSNKAGTIRGINAVPFILEGNFKDVIQTAFPDQIINMENDANCAVLGEVLKNKIPKNKIVASVVVGTGIGGCIWIKGHILRGKSNLAGEFGYSLNNDRATILSRTSSTRAMLNSYNEIFKTNFTTGDDMFMDASKKSTDILKPFLEKNINPFVNFIFNLQYFINPDYIIIGGGISKNEEYIKIIKEQINLKVNLIDEYIEIPKIIASKIGNQANLIGSLYATLENHKN